MLDAPAEGGAPVAHGSGHGSPAGPCGIGSVGMLPLMLLTLAGMKFARSPGRRFRHTSRA